MEKTKNKIQSSTDQRRFIMLYHDSLESDLLETIYEKILFVFLKKFADAENKCFPSVSLLAKKTGMSPRKVTDTLKELEKKKIISKEIRINPDGGRSSNLYTLHDYEQLWQASSSDDAQKIVDEMEISKMIDVLQSKGYQVEKETEKKPTSADQNTDVSSQNQLSKKNYTIEKKESQESERYTIQDIQEYFSYNILMNDHPDYAHDIDIVMNILYDTLNTSKKTVRVNGEDRPYMVVSAQLMKLTHEGIFYAIRKFKEQTEKIKNPVAYMLTLLYKAEDQMGLEIHNDIMYNTYRPEE